MSGRPDQPRPRIVVVSGASAGVGRATARAFAKDGCDVALLARGRAGLGAGAEEIRCLGRRALPIELDVADAESVFAAADRIENELGPIDVWVNVAMASVFARVIDITPLEFKRVTEVCYLGTVHGTLAALRHMQGRDHGHIIQIGSALAYRGIPLQSAYCASKHAVQGFCDSLRSELFHDKSPIRLTMIQLPAVNTPQFDWVRSKLPNRAQPVPPIYQPEVIADAVVWCSKRERRELLLGLSTLVVVWGNKLLPGLGDRYLARTGFKSQQTDEPEDKERPDNLWDPCDALQDHGAHGRFDSRAKSSSILFKLEKHNLLLALMIAVLFAPLAIGVLLGMLL